jgi:hypothetical protein
MTYTPDFSGIWAKLDRAEQHRQTLERETGFARDASDRMVSRLVAPPKESRVPMRLEFESETGYHVFRTATPLSEDSIRRWGLITGDVVHNLRCALDHLVWQLALLKCSGKEPRDAEKVGFPITASPPEGVRPREFKATSTLKDVLPEHRAIIYEHQPYGSRFDFSGRGAMHPFLRLKMFSNDDKHRVIPTVAVLHTGFTGFETLFVRDPDFEIVERRFSAEPGWFRERDAEIMRMKMRPASLQLNMEVAGYLSPNVCFRDVIGDTSYTIPVYLELLNITGQVLEVVREFDDLF